MKLQWGLALVAVLALAYGLGTYGFDDLFPSTERSGTDRPADRNAEAAPQVQAGPARAVTSRPGDGTHPRTANLDVAPGDRIAEQEDLGQEELGFMEGAEAFDPTYDIMVQKIADEVEYLLRQNYPEPVQENLSDEEILAEMDAAIAEAQAWLTDISTGSEGATNQEE